MEEHVCRSKQFVKLLLLDKALEVLQSSDGAFHSKGGGVLISVEAKLVMLVNVQAQIKMHNLFCLSTIM